MTHEKTSTEQDDGEMTAVGLKLWAMVGVALAKAVNCQYLTMESTAVPPKIIQRTAELMAVISEVVAISADPTECTPERIDPVWALLVDYVDFCNDHPLDQERHYVQ